MFGTRSLSSVFSGARSTSAVPGLGFITRCSPRILPPCWAVISSTRVRICTCVELTVLSLVPVSTHGYITSDQIKLLVFLSFVQTPPPLTKSCYGEVRLRIGTTCLSAALFAPAWLWSRDWQKCCNESSSSGTSSHRQWALWTWWWSRRVFPKPGCRGLWKAGREGFHNIQMMKFQHVNHFSFSEWNEPLCSTVLSRARAFRLYLKDSCST